MSATNNNNDVLYLHIAPNGKKYFGVTCQKPERRWGKGYGYKDNPHFWRAIQKYGWDNITHMVLADNLTPDEADLFEIFFIALYDTTNQNIGYNQDRGGRGKNQRLSEETRQKISEALKGNTLSEETKRKMSETKKGKVLSEETKLKIGEGNRGKIISEETKRKMSEAKTGKNNRYSKTVICTTTRQIFYGAGEAGRIIGIDNSSISKVCRGEKKSAGKLPDGTPLKWKYVKDLPKPQVSEEIKQLLRNGPRLLKSA